MKPHQLLVLLFFNLWFFQFSFAQDPGKGMYNFKEPVFTYGEKSYVDYFKEFTNFDQSNFKDSIAGRLVIQFLLSKSGELKEFVVIDSSSNPLFNKIMLDKLAISTAHWRSATINNNFVDVNIIASFYKTAFAENKNSEDKLNARYTFAVDPVLLHGYFNEGNSLVANEKFAEAISYFDQQLKYDPDNIEALFQRGISFLKSNEKEKACLDWRKIQSLFSSDADQLIGKYCNSSGNE